MSTKDPLSWAFHPDFAQRIVSKDEKVALRLLEVADIALTFARALVAKDYNKAHAALSVALSESWPPDALRRTLEEMIQYTGDQSGWPTGVQVVTGGDISEMGKWPRKTPNDFGWSYVSIHGDGYCEAVTVTVAAEAETLVIREIEWGRP